MVYTLGQAVKVTGMSKQAILAALRSGKISASQDEQRRWQIEPVELNRAYPHLTNSDDTHVDGADVGKGEPQKATPPNAYLLALQAEKKGLEKYVELVTNERDDLRRRLDQEIEERRRLITLLVDQRQNSWFQRVGLRR